MSTRILGLCLSLLATPLAAQTMSGSIEQASGFAGEMTVTMDGSLHEVPNRVTEVLRFEPWQMLDELFRDDIVFLMRHGPTDWSMRDVKDVAPTDCANQRVMTPDGKDKMRQLGALMVTNGLVPGHIAVSEWCRNQETVEALKTGMLEADPKALDGVEIETIPDQNLLLALQGAPNVTAMRNRIANWNGGDGHGPLLIITHYTNIAELTEFSVYEGEMLMVDPKRDNRVLGYLRLRSAHPDIGHFTPEVVDEYSDTGQ